MGEIIDGKAIAQKIRNEIKEEVKNMSFKPGLAVVLVGDNPASKVYVTMKGVACDDVGFYSEKHFLKEDISEQELLDVVKKLNEDEKIHGILVQLPLPKQIDEKKVINSISPSKDVDGFHPINVGALSTNQAKFVPCTPKGVIALIQESGIEIKGKHAVVIGRSNIVGKPISTLLLNNDATVTTCHRYTSNLAEQTKQADILVVAVGKPGLIKADMVKEGAVVIDVGVNRVEGRLIGDVDFENVKEKAKAITPVPGGVGPMTIAMLMKNTLLAAKEK